LLALLHQSLLVHPQKTKCAKREHNQSDESFEQSDAKWLLCRLTFELQASLLE
jgi:hypothetical protein